MSTGWHGLFVCFDFIMGSQSLLVTSLTIMEPLEPIGQGGTSGSLELWLLVSLVIPTTNGNHGR